MKCFLTNRCKRKNWCCNFCELKCDERCKDCHKGCTWYQNEPVDATDANGNIRFLKREIDAEGHIVEHDYSLEELKKLMKLKHDAEAVIKQRYTRSRTK